MYHCLSVPVLYFRQIVSFTYDIYILWVDVAVEVSDEEETYLVLYCFSISLPWPEKKVSVV